MYKQAVVLYADILGFKDIVQKRESETVYDILNLFAMPFKSEVLDSIAHDTNQSFSLDQLDEKYKQLVKDDEDLEDEVFLIDEKNGRRRCHFFSDLVLTSLQIDGLTEKDALSEFLDEVEKIIAIQVSLSERMILVRGGLTIDKIYHGKAVVFGPALIKAYEMESNAAIYPRICVDAEIVKRINRLENTKLPITRQSCISEDFDGAYFIDYLKHELSSWSTVRSRIGQNDYNDGGLHAFLVNHKEHVERHLSDAMGKPFENKLHWLRKYHNRVIREYGPRLKECSLNINDYLINCE